MYSFLTMKKSNDWPKHSGVKRIRFLWPLGTHLTHMKCLKRWSPSYADANNLNGQDIVLIHLKALLPDPASLAHVQLENQYRSCIYRCQRRLKRSFYIYNALAPPGMPRRSFAHALTQQAFQLTIGTKLVMNCSENNPSLQPEELDPDPFMEVEWVRLCLGCGRKPQTGIHCKKNKYPHQLRHDRPSCSHRHFQYVQVLKWLHTTHR